MTSQQADAKPAKKFIVYKRRGLSFEQFGGGQWQAPSPPLTEEQANQYKEALEKKQWQAKIEEVK